MMNGKLTNTEAVPTGDWIKLHRRMLDSEVFYDPWLCKLWIWCLLRASYTRREVFGMMIEPGQFVTGRISAAEELDASPSRVYRGFQTLQDLGCIKLDPDNKRTTITVCNWRTYQLEAPEINPQVNSQRTAGDTASGQPVIQPADTNKKGIRKEWKKGKREEGGGEAPPASASKPFHPPSPSSNGVKKDTPAEDLAHHFSEKYTGPKITDAEVIGIMDELLRAKFSPSEITQAIDNRPATREVPRLMADRMHASRKPTANSAAERDKRIAAQRIADGRDPRTGRRIEGADRFDCIRRF
jgi:hypothetical protein